MNTESLLCKRSVYSEPAFPPQCSTQYSPVAPLHMVLPLGRTNACVFSFDEWLNNLVWERKPFFPICFISWCSHACKGLCRLCKICMLIKSFTSSIWHVPPGQGYEVKRELDLRVILSSNKPSCPVTAVIAMLKPVLLQSGRTCSPSALTTLLLIAAQFC